ncbi:hypothetical protein OA436_01875 [Candidatus Pelagibacter sp.]|nr:hypothetical protein [Candidatus Pelagibacter sp.]
MKKILNKKTIFPVIKIKDNLLIIFISLLLVSCESPQIKKNLDQKTKSLNLKITTEAEMKANQ